MAGAPREFNDQEPAMSEAEVQRLMGRVLNGAIAMGWISDAERSALESAIRELPAGWVMVPVEPTQAMIRAGIYAAGANTMDVWRAMLAAATSATTAPAAPEVPNSPGFPDGSRVPADARDATGRSPTDYALEFAGYLARGAEQLMEACNALHMAVGTLNESGDDSDSETLQQARDSFSERFCSLHGDIHEFRKRRDRAAMAAPTPQPKE